MRSNLIEQKLEWLGCTICLVIASIMVWYFERKLKGNIEADRGSRKLFKQIRPGLILMSQKDMEFVWVSNHWDYHLEGICRMPDGRLGWFEAIDSCKDPDEWANYEIRPLVGIEKIKKVLNKFFFEVCVGYHWSYPQEIEGRMYRIRSPKFLHNILFNLFYSVQMMKRIKIL